MTIGDQAPPIHLQTDTGEDFDLSSLKGGFFACNATSFSLTRLVTGLVSDSKIPSPHLGAREILANLVCT